MTKYARQRFEILSRIPESLQQKLFEKKAVLAGGAVTSIFSGKKINDYDFYFQSRADADEVIAFVESADFGPMSKCSTDSAVTIRVRGLVFQFIIHPRFLTCAPQLLFDFSVCMAAYFFETGNFWFCERFFEDLAAQRLVFNIDSPYPICSIWRAKKYLSRGYNLPAIEMIKIALKVHSLDLNNLATLKEHLLGVDTLFLKELTDKLGGEENAEKSYDFEELCALMDRVLEEKYQSKKEADEENE